MPALQDRFRRLQKMAAGVLAQLRGLRQRDFHNEYGKAASGADIEHAGDVPMFAICASMDVTQPASWGAPAMQTFFRATRVYFARKR